MAEDIKCIHKDVCESYWVKGECDNCSERDVDYAPVVRCGKCEHWDTAHCNDGMGWCDMVGGYRRADWYCADGKEKDNDR